MPPKSIFRVRSNEFWSYPTSTDVLLSHPGLHSVEIVHRKGDAVDHVAPGGHVHAERSGVLIGSAIRKRQSPDARP